MHTHTHTHIYIYMFIYTEESLWCSDQYAGLRNLSKHVRTSITLLLTLLNLYPLEMYELPYSVG